MAEKFFKARKGLAVNSNSEAVSVVIGANDAVLLPVGNTSQRPAAANGYLRYNSELETFEGVTNNAWGEIAGGGGAGYYKGDQGAIGDTVNKTNIFRINANTLNANVTIVAGENAQATGPLTISTGFYLIVETGGRVSIV